MSGLFKQPKLPEPAPVTPLPDEKQATAARRRRVAKETATSSAQSTILSSGGAEKLGA